MDNEVLKPIKIYSSYTEAQKRANKKWREQNKERVAELHKKYYKPVSILTPEEIEDRRRKYKEYYNKNKDKIKQKREERQQKKTENYSV